MGVRVIFVFCQCGDRLYTSESTYKDGHRFFYELRPGHVPGPTGFLKYKYDRFDQSYIKKHE